MLGSSSVQKPPSIVFVFAVIPLLLQWREVSATARVAHSGMIICWEDPRIGDSCLTHPTFIGKQILDFFEQIVSSIARSMNNSMVFVGIQ